MSALGQKRTFESALTMSAFGGKADILRSPHIAVAAALIFAVDLSRVQGVDWDEPVVPAGDGSGVDTRR